MGCWCETCQISGLPISYGEPMVTIVLKKNEYAEHEGGNITYPTDLWEVDSYAIRGKYNDYGVPENMEENALTAELLHKYNSDDIDSLIENIERGEVPDTAVFYILEDVYNEIISMNGLTFKYQENIFRPENKMDVQKEKLDNLIKMMRQHKVENIVAVVDESGFSLKYRIKDEKKLEEMNLSLEKLKSTMPMFLKRVYRRSESMYAPMCDFYDRKGYYDSLTDELKYDYLELNFKKTFEMYMLQKFMMMTRCSFCPRSGKGNQNNNFEMFIEMFEFFKSIAKKEEEKFEE